MLFGHNGTVCKSTASCAPVVEMICRMISAVRATILVLVVLASVCPAFADRGVLGPAFSKIPFDEWLAQGGHVPFKWSVHITNVQLSTHQRLRAEIEAQIDGAELAKRRGKGQLEVYLQISDTDNVRYQDHGSI